jgi:hypothetical protein
MHMRPPVISGVLSLLFSAAVLFAQQPGPATPLLHGQLTKVDDQHFRVTAITGRPMYQALSAVSREYGWMSDYEETDDATLPFFTDGDNRRWYRGGTFTATLAMPQTGTASEEQSILTNLTRQFDQVGLQHFKVISPSANRFDVTSAPAGSVALMDTPITLPAAERTIDQTVMAILQQISAQRGVKIIRGGFADGELIRTTISIGSEKAVPARQLLAQALDQAPDGRVWLLTYEPSMGEYAFGVQATALDQQALSGGTLPRTIPNKPAR